jgi:hypothetical protein
VSRSMAMLKAERGVLRLTVGRGLVVEADPVEVLDGGADSS